MTRDAAMAEFSTCDLCDAHEDRLADGRLQVLAPGYVRFGRRIRFAGPAFTIQVHEDNALVRRTLERAGEGRVLVIDGGASRHAALVGGNLAGLGAQNGWAGLLVNGCVRDAEELDASDIGVHALALCPRRSAKIGAGQIEVVLRFSNIVIEPGYVIYADRDGVLVSSQALLG